ncbi:MAG TPA: hypothetical protein VHQ89_02840 [Gaiellaceae bacterium]|jgi:hypothetical protein|nr:hypothetical protein [Gaiellaceae bacterium]
MRNDMVARLAAANPVPGPAPVHEPLRARRLAVAAVVMAAIAVPAVAFGSRLAGVLGISNEGSSVPVTSVLPGQSQLDQALQEMQVGSTMQYLGALDGVKFYAQRTAGGKFCFAIDHYTQQYEKGVLCDWNTDNFPSPNVQAITFPGSLQGVAADGVATVEFQDENGAVLDSTPVTNNLFVSDQRFEHGQAAYLVTLDAGGNVISKQTLP